jgi:ABC-type Fe3+-hydroxamate transport system substrate-binding protein
MLRAAVDPELRQFLLDAVLREAAARGSEIDAVHFLILVEAGEDDGLGAGHRVTVALQTLRAAELVGLSPDVILASTTPAAAALRQQSRTIPIVFVQLPQLLKDVAPSVTRISVIFNPTQAASYIDRILKAPVRPTSPFRSQRSSR